MESVAAASDSCILEEKTTLIFDAAHSARRKRTEIRRFKQMSSSRNAHHSLLKRSSPVLEAEKESFSLSHARADEDLPLASQFLAEIRGKEFFGRALISSSSSLLRESGLVRSKSFPPEGWHRSASSKCILKISKTSAATGVEGRFVTVLSDEHGSSSKDAQADFRATWSTEVVTSSPPSFSSTAVRDRELHQRDEKLEEVQQIVENPSPLEANISEPMSEGGEIASEDTVEDVSTVLGGHGEGLPCDASLEKLEMMDPARNEAPSTVSEEVFSTINNVSQRRSLNDGRCPPSGKLLVCGRRREMEDTAAIVPSFASLSCDVKGGCYCDREWGRRTPSALHFFAVYDGHGGSQASNYCAERFHQALAEELTKSELVEDHMGDLTDGWDVMWEKAMTACFLKMDKEVGGVCPNGECDDVDSTSTCCTDAIAPENVGTTAVVVVVGSCHIVVGNCGDSRAVLSRGGNAIPLSKDHKPEREDETSRIEAAGGRVIYWDGYRVGGLLALSRAIGDRYLKRYVVSEPEVTFLQRTEEDECLIIASDGLWDVVSNDVACEVARKCFATARRRNEFGASPNGEDSASAYAAGLLVKLAYGRGSKDNITVVVVDLTSRDR